MFQIIETLGTLVWFCHHLAKNRGTSSKRKVCGHHDSQAPEALEILCWNCLKLPYGLAGHSAAKTNDVVLYRLLVGEIRRVRRYLISNRDPDAEATRASAKPINNHSPIHINDDISEPEWGEKVSLVIFYLGAQFASTFFESSDSLTLSHILDQQRRLSGFGILPLLYRFIFHCIQFTLEAFGFYVVSLLNLP